MGFTVVHSGQVHHRIRHGDTPLGHGYGLVHESRTVCPYPCACAMPGRGARRGTVGGRAHGGTSDDPLALLASTRPSCHVCHRATPTADAQPIRGGLPERGLVPNIGVGMYRSLNHKG